MKQRMQMARNKMKFISMEKTENNLTIEKSIMIDTAKGRQTGRTTQKQNGSIMGIIMMIVVGKMELIMKKIKIIMNSNSRNKATMIIISQPQKQQINKIKANKLR